MAPALKKVWQSVGNSVGGNTSVSSFSNYAIHSNNNHGEFHANCKLLKLLSTELSQSHIHNWHGTAAFKNPLNEFFLKSLQTWLDSRVALPPCVALYSGINKIKTKTKAWFERQFWSDQSQRSVHWISYFPLWEAANHLPLLLISNSFIFEAARI